MYGEYGTTWANLRVRYASDNGAEGWLKLGETQK